jgi:hypothetical protein
VHRSSFRPQVERLDDRCLPSFLAPASYAVTAHPLDVISADFNNDGRPDLAVSNNSYPSASVGVLLGKADGTFQPPVASAAGSAPDSLAVGDFDRDGKMDLVAADAWGYVRLLRGNGDGTFTTSANVSLGSPWTGDSVAVGDFNGDGLLDLGITATIVNSSEYGDFPYGVAVVLLGDGAGGLTLASSCYLGDGYHTAAIAADLNGDAKLDFVCVNSDYGSVVVLFGDGTGKLGGVTLYGPIGNSGITARDLDGDGDADLVMGVGDRGIGVMRNYGAGGFGPAQFSATGNHPLSIVIGDFNNDGRPDVAAPGSDTCTVLLGLGDGTFSSPIPVGIGSSGAATAGDFNGDGWLDLATTTYVSDNVSVLLNDHNWTPPPPSIAIGDVSITEGNTGTRAAAFTVTLSKASGQPVTVNYATANGTAAAGSDYRATSGTLTIPAGQTTGTITVLVFGDRIAEANETFFFNLSAPSNATIADGQGMGTIMDDEPHISISDVSMKEGKKGQTTGFTFTVTLSAAYDQAVTVSFRTTAGTAKTSDQDYVARTGTLTFAPGETTKTITIVVNGDSKKEADESFYVDLFGNGSNSLVTRNRGVGRILNDD